MKVQALSQAAAAQEAHVGEERPAIGVRALFLALSLAVVLAAHAPIAALAAKIIS